MISIPPCLRYLLPIRSTRLVRQSASRTRFRVGRRMSCFRLSIIPPLRPPLSLHLCPIILPATRVSTIFINEILHVTLGRNLSKKKQPPLFVRSHWTFEASSLDKIDDPRNWRLIRTRKTEKMQERVRRSEKVNATCPLALLV